MAFFKSPHKQVPHAAYCFLLIDFFSGPIKIIPLAYNSQMFILKNFTLKTFNLFFHGWKINPGFIILSHL